MDFGSFGESNLLSNESSGNGGGAGGGLGISANNLLKSLGGRSLIADTDYGKCQDDENQQQTSRDMKIPFELRGGGSNTTTSNHRNNAAAGADYMSPWAVHALLQHQTYSPFRNPSGVHMPLSMIGRDGGMHGGAALQLGRGGCCFTALQWQELEHQALIFKYILAQEPVPPELIMPIKRSLGASNDFASHHHQPNLGWGAFQMRFANVKADAEPGRCRRTDGKKWRCSRDAAPDQKYCERHMHRGRPRSRKPVEGGQTAINASSNNNNNNNNTNATTNPSAGVGGGGASQPLNVGGHGPLSPHGASFSSLSALGRSSSLRPSSITTTPSISVTDSHNNNNNNNTDQFLNLKSLYGSSAMSMSTGNNNNNNSNNNGVSHFKTPLNMVSSASAASACKDYRYMNWMKGEGEDNHNNQMLVSEKTDNTTSMMIPNNNNSNNWRWSPSTKLNINNPTTTSTTSSILQYTSSPQMRSLMGTHDLSFDSLNQQSHFLSETQQPLRHFIDDWGASSDEHHHHNHQNQNQRSSQLSMSLPMASTDLGLGLMMNNQEPSHHHSRSYIPVALGGPLAEALQHSGNNHNTTTSKNGKSGALNLLSNEGWDFGSPHQSPRMASPTGVLQKTLASLSDSSSGSSAVVAKHDTLHHNLSNAT